MAITHLIVDNGNYSVTVHNKVVKNLYDVVKALYAVVPNHTAEDCYIRGTISVVNAHPSYVEYLEENFPDLHITMTGEAYIENDDKLTQSKLGVLGDGVGLTVSAAAAITSVYSAFSGYSNLVDGSFFQYFTGLANATASNSTASTFYNCTRLAQVILPQGLKTIGARMFEGCGSLTSISIPNSVTSIASGDRTYNGYTYQYEGPFVGCTNLTSVVIGTGLTQIGSYAFVNCSSLTSVHISDLAAWSSITCYQQGNPLYYAHHLYLGEEEIVNLVIPNGVTSIGRGAFYGGSAFTSLSIPDSVTTIGQEAFRDCSSLTSVTIPDSVTSIENYAFYGCRNLTTISIGNSVTRIGSQCFRGNNYLSSVTVRIETPLSIDSYTFENRANATLYVPYGCSAAYRAANYWKEFNQIIELPEE